MIVDLARNDLGRVCEPGSVTVPGLCELEPHPGLVHLVSTVRGSLRDDVGLGGLLRATFPPASVTGAPKPRVLQEIEDLEPVRRGIYCGAVGWIDTVTRPRPTSRSRSARSCHARRDAARRRRRHHRGLGPGRGVAGDRAQGGAPARRSREPAPRAVSLAARR